MNKFDDRKKGFEKKFVKDQETEFKVLAKRNKYLGLWAAEKLGKRDSEIDSYVLDVIKSDFEEPGDQDIIRKVKKDFNDSSVAITEKEIEERLKQFYDKAIAEISS